jgi:Ca2+-binding RTX toxin-like protein
MASTPSPDLGSILSAAIAGGYVANLSGATYTVTSPIVIHIDSTIQGPLGIDLGGATIVSQITNGAPVIEIDVGPGVDVRYLTLSNFTIQGNGHEGDGIKIVADGNDRWLYNWNIDNVTVQHVGGYGLDVQGSVFEGLVSNSWMNDNGKGGAYFAHLDAGQASALRWFGGGAENNGGAGMTLDNGTRDMSVDGATFSNNGGAGIEATSGITSVTDSTFDNNTGKGIDFQLYGNFNNDTFTTSGAQTVGISGYVVGNTSLIGNVATGSETLAQLSGNGGSFQSGNAGTIVDGSGVSVSGMNGGNQAHVTVSSQGMQMPVIAHATAAATTIVASSNGTSVLESAIEAAVAGGTAVHTHTNSYTVTAPIIINVTSSSHGGIIDLGGAKIISQISGGGPVIEIIVAAGVKLDGLTLENFSINGNGQEGDGIKIVADGTDRSVVNLVVSNVSIEHTGGVGLDVLGNVSQATVYNSWMNGNALGGARFANSANGGVASDLAWEGGGFRKNGAAGLILDNGTHDMSVKGAYFVENIGPGLNATSGITNVQASGFENNGGAGAFVQGSSNFTNDTFSTYGPQKVAVAGYLTSGQMITLTDPDVEYYGSGSDPTVAANVQGSGMLAIAGGGNVIAGPHVTVTGGQPVFYCATGATPGGTPVPPTVTLSLASDTGISSGDALTANAALSGTADPNAVVHFTVDGTATAATVKADANGVWSFVPTGLADGAHTIVASETNAAGATGSASLTFVLDTAAPVVTEQAVTGTVTGTGDPHGTVHFTIDGKPVADTVVANATGNWTYTPAGLAAGTHTIVASETDAAGNTGSATTSFALNPVPIVTAALSNDTGASSTDRITSNAALAGTADPNAVVHFTLDGNAIAPTATADATGAWSFTPVGLGDGTHTIVASETSAGGTGSASLSFTLDTHAPVPTLTSALFANGQITVSGTTGEAGDTVSLYDGYTWVAMTTTDATGHFTFVENGSPGTVHSFGANATDIAGSEGHGIGHLVVGGVTPTVTMSLTSDTGCSAPDHVTSNAALSGTADANSVVHFTVDGSAVAATATADAGGAWSFAPAGLADGLHTIVASETNDMGNTGSASLSLTLQTHAPTVIFTGGTIADGQITVTGSTGEAGDSISLYDGNDWVGMATTGSNGTFTFMTAATHVVHSFGANATNLAGLEGHGAAKLILGSSTADSLVGTSGNDIIVGNGGNDHITGGAGADTLTAGSGSVTFVYNSVSDSTSSAADTITDFHHAVDKIDFTNIAGIAASGGVPLFQGNITGAGNVALNAHSVAYMEVGGGTQVLVNATSVAETVSATDTHAADMKIALTGVNLGLAGSDFHHS